jgi:hypothetical protein
VAWHRRCDTINHSIAKGETNHKLIVEIVNVYLAEMNHEQLWIAI